MREHHETEGDRQNEQIICSFWLNAWRKKRGFSRTFQKLPEKSYKLDYAVLDDQGQIVCWLEIKNRPTGIPYDLASSRQTLLLSVLKWNSLAEYRRSTGRPAVLLVRFSDGTVGTYTWKRADAKQFRIEWGGRTKATRDAGDIEPVIHIPLTAFEVWGTLPAEELA